jgi:hypothetical protein
MVLGFSVLEVMAEIVVIGFPVLEVIVLGFSLSDFLAAPAGTWSDFLGDCLE